MSEGEIRDLLLKAKADLEGTSSSAEESRKAVELDQTKVGRLSRMDAIQQQAMDNAIEARRQNSLKRITAALKRLDEGEYGYCLKCGDEIAAARLHIDPATPLCADCAE
ncbi:MAG: TraR/DksA family transcriptional regulator [Sphingomonadales bacterium]|jgi:DnaK suppressor protein